MLSLRDLRRPTFEKTWGFEHARVYQHINKACVDLLWVARLVCTILAFFWTPFWLFFEIFCSIRASRIALGGCPAQVPKNRSRTKTRSRIKVSAIGFGIFCLHEFHAFFWYLRVHFRNQLIWLNEHRADTGTRFLRFWHFVSLWSFCGFLFIFHDMCRLIVESISGFILDYVGVDFLRFWRSKGRQIIISNRCEHLYRKK